MKAKLLRSSDGLLIIAVEHYNYFKKTFDAEYVCDLEINDDFTLENLFIFEMVCDNNAESTVCVECVIKSSKLLFNRFKCGEDSVIVTG